MFVQLENVGVKEHDQNPGFISCFCVYDELSCWMISLLFNRMLTLPDELKESLALSS